jgi:hypothetical protein
MLKKRNEQNDHGIRSYVALVFSVAASLSDVDEPGPNTPQEYGQVNDSLVAG